MSAIVTKNVVFGQAWGNLLIASLSALPGAALLAAAKLRLSKDPAFNPQPSDTAASLSANEADFSGYVAGGVAVVLIGGLNVTPLCQAGGQNKLYVATVAAPFVPNGIFGWWIDDGANLVLASAFGDDGPVQIAAAGDYLELMALLPVNLLQTAAL